MASRSRPLRRSNRLSGNASPTGRDISGSRCYWQRHDVIGVSDSMPSYRILELELESPGWPDTTSRGERAAKHHGALRQFGVSGAPFDEIGRGTHRRHRSLLIENAPIAFPNPRTQEQIVPMAA